MQEDATNTIPIKYALEVNSLSKSYPGVEVLKNVCFKVGANNIHGFLGPNGAGKSTTMKIISGLIPLSSGSIIIQGHDIEERTTPIGRLIGYLPENLPLYPNMTTIEYLTFVSSIHNRAGKANKDLIDHAIMKCGLLKESTKLIGKLSKGYKQRVGIAQTLCYGAPIIILDEPLVGLDPNAVIEIRELITDLKKEHTIILSTHQLYEAKLICDEITIINQGEIIKNCSADQIDLEEFFKGLKSL